MEAQIIPLFGSQPRLPGLPAESQSQRKKKPSATKDKSTEYASPAMVATTIISQRQCLVCTKPTGKTHTRYCPEHTGSFWKWLQCSEPGCEIVGERTIPGQTLYRCPAHSRGQLQGPLEAVQEDNAGRGRMVVRELLAQRRQALAKEKAKKQLPPRPPNNIGHYDHYYAR